MFDFDWAQAHPCAMKRAYHAAGALGLALALGWIPRLAAAVPPGRLLPVVSRLPQAMGSVSSSGVAPDGSVILRGDFIAVDGIARPGLAVLSAAGRLETRFRPETVAISGRPSQPPYVLGGGPVSSGLFLGLEDGTWFYSFPDHPLVYRPDGREDARYGFVRGSDHWAEALFAQDGMVYFARHRPDGRRLEAVCIASKEPVVLDAQEAWPAPFDQAAPAGPGHLWILGRDDSGYSPGLIMYTPAYWLFRVDIHGELDPAFEPVELDRRFYYRLAPRAGGGFRMVRTDATRWWYWPGPSSDRYGVDLHDADGHLLATRWIDLPLMSWFAVEEEADGSLLHNTVETHNGLPVQMLVRIRPDGTPDPDFRVRLDSISFQLLADGRIQHSHIHRILPDGTPDPSWRIPQLVAAPDVQVIGVFDDGGIVVNVAGGLADPARPALMALGPDRQPDPAFRPPADLPPVAAYRMARDGRSLLLVLRGIHEFPDGTRTRVLRLRRDGSLDPDSPRYLPPSGIIFIHPDGLFGEQPYTGPFHLHPLTDGGFLAEYMPPFDWQPAKQIERLRPDGSPDPDFSPLSIPTWQDSVHVLPDDRFLFGRRLYAADGAFVRELDLPGGGGPVANAPDGRLLIRYSDGTAGQLALLDIETGPLPDFETAFLDGTRIHQVVPAGEGAWIVEGDLHTPAGVKTLVRLYEDGRIDPTFRAPRAVRTVPWTWGLRSVIREGERVPATMANRAGDVRMASLAYDPERKALLAGGSFTHAGFWPRRGLAWLSLGRLRNFDAWLDEFLSDLLDGGAMDWADRLHADWEDYALGTDPADPREERGLRAIPGAARQFRLAINPDADDVAFDVEVSDDLVAWRAPRIGEIAVERRRAALHIRLPDDAPALFVRIRYRKAP